jgi:hypothetical protein
MVLKRRRDGNYDLRLGAVERGLVVELCTDLAEALRAGVENPSFRRLSPTAYPEAPQFEQAYQSLTADELVAARVGALETVRENCEDGEVAPDEIDAWLTSLNALRLVIGTELDVGEQHDSLDVDEDDPDFQVHVIYDFLTALLAMFLAEASGRL